MKYQMSVADRRRLARITHLFLDVDGVLTDGKLHFGSDCEEFKTFDVQDGHGISMAQRAGLVVGLVSGRPSRATAQRAADLCVKIVLQGARNKMEMIDEARKKNTFQNDEVCFVGDELVDLPVMKRVGFAVAVSNAVPEVKKAARYVTKRKGGDGAVREVIELILKAQGRWQQVIAKYLVIAAVLFSAGAQPLLADDSERGDSPPVTGFIEKFEVPNHDENGNLRWKLAGDKAQIGMDGVMNVINARAEFYSSNRLEIVLIAPECLLDRVNRSASTESAVRIEQRNIEVTGIGAAWDDASSLLVVRSNVHVLIRGGASFFQEQKKPATNMLLPLLKLPFLLFSTPAFAEDAPPLPQSEPPRATNTVEVIHTEASSPEPSVVTSDRLQVDYARNMGTFEGNVLAVDPRITVRADRMVVAFGVTTNGSRSIQKIQADGAVVITQGERKATSDQAEYTAEDGKMVLSGNPQVQGPDGLVAGQRITFWRDQDRMDVESGTRLVIYPDQLKENSPQQGDQMK